MPPDTEPPELVPPAPPVVPDDGHQPPPEPAPAGNGKIVTISRESLAKIHVEEREKGRKSALKAANRQAQELGYRDHAHMVQSLQAAKAGKTGTTPTTSAPATEPPVEPALSATDSRDVKKLARENARLAEQHKRVNQARAKAEKEARLLQKKLDAQEAENELRIAATRAGVHDIPYAIHLLRQKLSKATPKELESFNEDAFFSTDLRNSHPYLYGVQTVPANTGPTDAGGKGGTLPAPGAPPSGGGSTEKVDVRKMSKEDYEKYLRSKGLSAPSLGMPG